MALNISPTGSISKPIKTPVGPGNVSFNPITASVGANANVLNSGSTHVNVGAGVGPGGVGVTPQVQIGDSPGAAAGASGGGIAGGLAGAAVGGPVGAAVGSGVGSALGSVTGGAFAGNEQAQKETKSRDSFFSALNTAGLTDDHKLTLPDGSTWDTSANVAHAPKYADKLVGNYKPETLHSYETDYTSDLDYVSSMAGTTLSRLLGGGKSKAIDQAGNSLGNAFLGKAGYGADFNQENFSSVMTNARAAYAKKGISSKADFLGLANKAYSQGRLNDADYAAAQQTAGLVFDNNYSLGQQLMAGRWDGLKTAAKGPASSGAQTPSDAPQTAPQHDGRWITGPNGKRVFAPIISPQEALASVKPFFDYYKQNYPGAIRKPNSTLGAISTGTSILGGVTALGGLYNTVNHLTNGSLGNFIFGAQTPQANGPVVPQLPGMESGGVDSGLSSSDLGLSGSDFATSDVASTADVSTDSSYLGDFNF